MSLGRTLRLALVAPAAALMVAALPMAAHADATRGPQEIAFLNAQRAANGIPADVTEVPEWSLGCEHHMSYLKQNNLFQHEEDGKPGNTVDGKWAGLHAVLTSGGSSFSATGVNAFEHAPIHLMQMLDPFMLRSGAADGCLITLGDIGRTAAAPTTFSYPGDGATNVPTSEVSFEGPWVPAAFVGLADPASQNQRSVVTGPSLYFYNVNVGGYGNSLGSITSASLTGPSAPVEVRTVDNNTTAGAPLGNLGNYLAPGGILIPVAPLQKDATYTATVNFAPDASGAVTRTWSFVTGAAPAPAPPVMQAPVTVTPTPVVTPTPTNVVDDSQNSSIVVRAVTLKSRSLSITAGQASKIWVTVEYRQPKKAKKKAKWVLRRSFAITTKANGPTRVTLPRPLARGRYRVRLRDQSATGDLVTERSVTVR